MVFLCRKIIFECETCSRGNFFLQQAQVVLKNPAIKPTIIHRGPRCRDESERYGVDGGVRRLACRQSFPRIVKSA